MVAPWVIYKRHGHPTETKWYEHTPQLQLHAESFLVGNSKDCQKDFGYLRLRDAPCYPKNTNNIKKIKNVRHKTEIIIK